MDEFYWNNWKNLRILITGSSGFLGQRLAWRLSQFGTKVFGLDYRGSHSGRDLFVKPPCLDGFIFGDVRDYADVERAIAEFKPSVVFHLAAITQVVDAELIPLQAFETNIMGTANVLQAIRASGMRILTVVASSDKAYGRIYGSEVSPANETTFLDPYHPYDVSKASADFIARCYAKIYDQKVSVTRCGNIYGPGDTNWQRIIPDTIRSLGTGQTLHIRSDGTHVREYNYVDDVIDAYLLVAKNLVSGGPTGVSWTISDPNTRLSVMEMAEAVASEMRIPLIFDIGNTAKSEGQEIRLDSSLIRERLGWYPRTGLSIGLRKTIEWVRSLGL